MKWVILAAVLAALVTVSQANTCSGVTKCVTIMSAAAREQVVNERCRKMREALDCMSSSIADCEKQGKDQSMIDTYQSQLKNVRAQLDEKCRSTSVTSGANTCHNFASCITDNAPKGSGLEAECRAGRKVVDCMDSSLADCKKQGEAQFTIDSNKKMLEELRDKLHDECGSSMAKVSIAALLLSVILAIVM